MSEQSKNKLYPKVNRKPNNTGGLIVAICMAIFVLSAVIVGLFVFSKPDISGKREESDFADYHTDEHGNKYVTSLNEHGDSVKVEIDKVAKDNHYNFLVVGKDRAYFNTDVIMLASFDTDSGAVSIMQIPRDTYIELVNDTRRVKKANSLLAHFYNENRSGNYKKDLTAALGQLKSAVSEVLGVPIDYYVMLDLNGFVNIVNAIGGVDMYVPRDMKYDDPDQGLYIDLKKGQQNLNGDEAEQFIRFRKGYANADLGRVDAQKLFMRAFIEKVQKKFNLNTIVGIAEQLTKYVITDLEINEIMFFAKSALGIDSEKVAMSTLPGDLAGSYYVASRSGTYDAINLYFNPYNTALKQDKFDPNGGLYDKEGTRIYAVYTGDDSLLAYLNSEDIKIPHIVTTAEEETSAEPEETTAPESGAVHTGTEEPVETDNIPQTSEAETTSGDETEEFVETTTAVVEDTNALEEIVTTDVFVEETTVMVQTEAETVETTVEESLEVTATETVELSETATIPSETTSVE